MGERTLVQIVLVIRAIWPPLPYMVKTLQNLLFQNQKTDDLGNWHVAFEMWGLQVCSNDKPG